MTKSVTTEQPLAGLQGPSPVRTLIQRLPFYYGWINLMLASFAMLATLPGRSVGLGLITEPLIADLRVERLAFGQMNFWATLVGATFSLMCGPFVDRYGVRVLVTLVALTLGAVVLGLSQVTSGMALLLLLILVRGFGQSALSSVSLTMVGKWFVRRLSHAMAIFSVLIGIGFAAAILVVQSAVQTSGWRSTWSTLGWSIVALALLSWLLARRSPESCGVEVDPASSKSQNEPQLDNPVEAMIGFTLSQALITPAFWLFAIGSALYNLVVAGVMLFNQSILKELGFGEQVFQYAMAGFMFLGVTGNLFAGWLAQRWSLGKLMGVAMLLLTAALLGYPHLAASWQVIIHAMVLGLVGGFVTVIFFTAYGKTFGRRHLGKIQGAAQVFAVLASASGPWLLAYVLERTGSYTPGFYIIAPAIAIVGICAWWVPIPRPEEALP
ncbi:MFS transporter [bacterium]|nr:MFS transporter [bacterium]